MHHPQKDIFHRLQLLGTEQGMDEISTATP